MASEGTVSVNEGSKGEEAAARRARVIRSLSIASAFNCTSWFMMIPVLDPFLTPPNLMGHMQRWVVDGMWWCPGGHAMSHVLSLSPSLILSFPRLSGSSGDGGVVSG